MKIRVLGCSGGIGAGLRTTSLLVDEDVLIDCGTGVGDLTQDELRTIRHIFITHGHLDHIAFIPFLIDSVFDTFVDNPLTIHLQQETMLMLRQHIFNWQIWPDYSQLPDEKNPVIRYDVMTPGQQVDIDGRLFQAIPVTHIPGAVGYRLQSPAGGSFAYSGDTKSSDEFWDVLNAHSNLDVLIIECAYPDHKDVLGEIAGHHRPTTLAADLQKLRHQPELYIMHLKPGDEEQVLRELATLIEGRSLKELQRGQVFEL